jgi:hypothetical protein
MHLLAQPVGADWNIVVYGGERPHVGAVALAGPEFPCSLLALPKHREGDIAKRLAVALANHFNATVCASCGIHLDEITPEEIEQVHHIVEKFISELTTKYIQ